MVDAALMAQFGVMAALMVMIPGADWGYAMAAGLRARRVLPSIGGMLAGYVVLVSVIAVGLGAVVTTHPEALVAITVLGSGYLLWLGATTLRRAGAPVVEAVTGVMDAVPALVDDPRGQFLKGAGVSGFNPKALLLLLALLPQFVRPDGWAVPAQLMVLGSLFILCCAIVYTVVAQLSRRILRSRPSASTFMTRASGVMMLAIGVSLIVEKVVEISA